MTDVPAQTLNAPSAARVKRGFYSTFRSAVGVTVGLAARLAGGIAFYAAIPLYVSHLGVDQFSYIAFYQTLLVLASLLDGGLAPVITSQVARYNQSGSDFSASSNVVAAGERLGLFVGIAIYLLAAAMALLPSVGLIEGVAPSDTLGSKVTLAAWMTASLGLIPLERIYYAIVVGQHRQDLAASARLVTSIARQAVPVALITYWDQGVITYFIVQAIVGLGGLVCLRWAALGRISIVKKNKTVLPLSFLLANAWGPFLLVLAGTVVSQTDKLLIWLSQTPGCYASYAICWAAAAMIPILAGGVAQGLLPVLVGCVRSNDTLRMNQLARLGSEVAAISSVPIALELLLNGENVFLLLTNRHPTDFPASVVMASFAIGFLINAVICIPVTLQIALNDLRLTTRSALAMSAFIPFAVIVLHLTCGVSGVSICWPLANAIYLFTILVWHQRRFGTSVNWLKTCVARPLFYGFLLRTVGTNLTIKAPYLSQSGEIEIAIHLALCAVGCAIAAVEVRSYIYLRLRSGCFITRVA